MSLDFTRIRSLSATGKLPVFNEQSCTQVQDQTKIMIGGAPVTKNYCNTIRADAYTADAASAADQAVAYCA